MNTIGQTILIADDEKDIREILRLYIEKEGYNVLQAENGLKALALAKSEPVDLAVVDIMMPELDGYELIKALREHGNLPVIVLSAKTENHEKILGLDLGADDYVTKPFDPLEVVARIRAQLRRNHTRSSGDELLQLGALTLDTGSCTLRRGDESIPLTATEFGIMTLLAPSPGHVFTKKQIYAAGWPDAITTVPDDNAIMVAISKLRGKLPGGSGVTIGTVRGLGYRLEVRR